MLEGVILDFDAGYKMPYALGIFCIGVAQGFDRAQHLAIEVALTPK
jgi:hypothetical protein